MSQSCLKHLAKQVYEVERVSKGHSLTLVKGHSDFKVKTCFLKNSWAIWNQNSYESLRENKKCKFIQMSWVT